MSDRWAQNQLRFEFASSLAEYVELYCRTVAQTQLEPGDAWWTLACGNGLSALTDAWQYAGVEGSLV